jgi:heme exporter protein A
MRLLVDNLAVERGERRIFEAISFCVEEGGALVITGANGSGKSTLLKTIAGLLRPAAGKIELDGRGERNVAQCCHYLGHENALKPALTVAENLNFWRQFLELFDFGAGLDMAEALDTVGLPEVGAIPAGYLSAGQKRRLAIARLLVCRRPVWLLDEPTAALDVPSGRMFSLIAEQHASKGGILVAATHQPLEIPTFQHLELNALHRETAS